MREVTPGFWMCPVVSFFWKGQYDPLAEHLPLGYCVTLWGCCLLSAEGARHCGLIQSQVVCPWFEMFWRDLSCVKNTNKSASGCLFVCLCSAGISQGFGEKGACLAPFWRIQIHVRWKFLVGCLSSSLCTLRVSPGLCVTAEHLMPERVVLICGLAVPFDGKHWLRA